MNHHIVFTGGGTAGHVTPNIALMEVFQKEGWNISYVGGKESIEERIIQNMGLPFYAIASGKLRRYFSMSNFLSPLRVLVGIAQAYCLLKRLKATIVFSKGGFAAFPVVVAAFLCRIPCVVHESDMTPGLANRLSFPFASKMCVNFAPTLAYYKHHAKVELTGTLLRSQILQGNKEKALRLCGFLPSIPCLLIVGGSLGAKALNEAVRAALPTLTQQYQIIHLCGKGKVDVSLQGKERYYQQEYANEEMADFFAASTIIVSRAGANSVYEMLFLHKLHLLIPLSTLQSRGDQMDNARYFQQQGASVMLAEENLTPATLVRALQEIEENRDILLQKMQAIALPSGNRIVEVLKTLSLSTHE